MLRTLIAIILLTCSTVIIDQNSVQMTTSLIKGTILTQQFWTYESSGLTPLSKKKNDSLVAQVYAGTLRINPFGVLTSPSNIPISDVEIQLSTKSDPLHIQIQRGTQRIFLDITPTTYQLQNNGDWLPCSCAETFRLYTKNQQTWMNVGQSHTKLASFPLSSIELSSKIGTAHLLNIQILDQEYGIIYKKNFSEQSTPTSYSYLAMAIGSLSGLLLAIIIIQKKSCLQLFLTSLFLYPSILLVMSIQPEEWSVLQQKLYLTQTEPWELAQVALFIAIIPIIIMYLSLLPLKRKHLPSSILTGPLSWVLYGSITILFLFWSNIHQPWGWFLIWEYIFLLLPLWLFRNIGINRYLICTEIPTFLCIASLGWGFGLFLATIWRLLLLLSSISMYRKHKMTQALDCIALTILFIPTSLEATIRSTYLNKAWDVRTLTAKYNQEDPSEYLISMWNESCKKETAKHQRKIVFVGGSSTGGVYQFRQTPHLFFAGHTHAHLCAQVGSKYTINTKNYGRAAMDTHIIAQSFDSLLHTTKADIVVMYVGNNDLLTRKSPLSKKQLQQRMEHWNSQISGIKSYTSSSRLIIGSSLVFRQLDQRTKMVVSVPTYDAQENFEHIAKIAKTHNTQVLLLTEFINPSVIQPIGKNSDEININAVFTEYATIQQNIAQKYAHMHYLDTWSALNPYIQEDLFIDSNHLNRQGNKRVADIIVPKMIEILQSIRD